MNKKYFTLIFFILFCLFSAFGQSSLVNKYLEAANTEYSIRENEKAYNYINIVAIWHLYKYN